MQIFYLSPWGYLGGGLIGLWGDVNTEVPGSIHHAIGP